MTSYDRDATDAVNPIDIRLQQADIKLVITRKRVKNINFRLKPNHLAVSAPRYVSDQKIQAALTKRLDWILTHHQQILQRQAQRDIPHPSAIPDLLPSDTRQLNTQPRNVLLWGQPQPEPMLETARVNLYRQELHGVMPTLFAKWQPIVGQTAQETRIKKMTTRWGSCNTRAKRVWLSVYLPAYPIECTEYVIVHELCHLHHANHSKAFWLEVARSMPDYKRWHDRLAGKLSSID